MLHVALSPKQSSSGTEDEAVKIQQRGGGGGLILQMSLSHRFVQRCGILLFALHGLTFKISCHMSIILLKSNKPSPHMKALTKIDL